MKSTEIHTLERVDVVHVSLHLRVGPPFAFVDLTRDEVLDLAEKVENDKKLNIVRIGRAEYGVPLGLLRETGEVVAIGVVRPSEPPE